MHEIFCFLKNVQLVLLNVWIFFWGKTYRFHRDTSENDIVIINVLSIHYSIFDQSKKGDTADIHVNMPKNMANSWSCMSFKAFQTANYNCSFERKKIIRISPGSMNLFLFVIMSACDYYLLNERFRLNI